jgi:hypothetical protein
VAALFDPASSRADLISISEDPSEGVITLRWRLEGRLKLLGGLPIKPYTGERGAALRPSLQRRITANFKPACVHGGVMVVLAVPA